MTLWEPGDPDVEGPRRGPADEPTEPPEVTWTVAEVGGAVGAGLRATFPDEIWLRYRASVAHGLMTWLATASAGELWQRPDIALALAQRYSAAYEDLQTAQALADLIG